MHTTYHGSGFKIIFKKCDLGAVCLENKTESAAFAIVLPLHKSAPLFLHKMQIYFTFTTHTCVHAAPMQLALFMYLLS